MKIPIAYVIFLLAIISSNCSYALMEDSICHGTTNNGSLENGWQLPASGTNYEAYSFIGVTAGRNYVHSKVYKVILDAYKDLETSAPGKYFVYGETGFKEGGKFRPHKTHQNGLSADFFVPVVDTSGKSVALPTSIMNKLGYGIEFNSHAAYGHYSIDFEAMVKHLLAIKKASVSQGVGIRVVIFDNELQKLLKATSSGKSLSSVLKFSTKQSWVRHDEHYHIDFVVTCK